MRGQSCGVSRQWPGPCRSCIGPSLEQDCQRCPQCPRCLLLPRPLPPQRRSQESDLPLHLLPVPRRVLPWLQPFPQNRFQICPSGWCCCGPVNDHLPQECLQIWKAILKFRTKKIYSRQLMHGEEVKLTEFDTYIYQQQDTLVCCCVLFPGPSPCHLWWVARSRQLSTQSPQCPRSSLSESQIAAWNTHCWLDSLHKTDFRPKKDFCHFLSVFSLQITSAIWHPQIILPPCWPYLYDSDHCQIRRYYSCYTGMKKIHCLKTPL